jgi:hypothetical protein
MEILIMLILWMIAMYLAIGLTATVFAIYLIIKAVMGMKK